MLPLQICLILTPGYLSAHISEGTPINVIVLWQNQNRKMKKDQENRTQSKIYSGEAQISSLSSFHLHIICGFQSVCDMAHMWRTVIRFFLLLLSYFGGLAKRHSGTPKIICTLTYYPPALPNQIQTGKKNWEYWNPPALLSQRYRPSKLHSPDQNHPQKQGNNISWLIHHPGVHWKSCS